MRRVDERFLGVPHAPTLSQERVTLKSAWPYVLGLLIAAISRADTQFAPPSVGNAGAGAAGALLARMGSTPRFSSGAISPFQRNLVGEGDAARGQADVIYYSSLTLGPLPSTTIVTPLSTTPGISDFAQPGDSGVVTGDAVAGPGSISVKTVTTDPTPAPDSTVLAWIGLGTFLIWRPGRSRLVY